MAGVLQRRDAALDRLAGRSVDLLVIGAGIAGAATALAAARAGASVAVVEKGDVAGATSSASSKLLHGGLRYLRRGDVALVGQAHAARRATAEVIAPNLVTPMRFVIPVLHDGPVHLWQVRAGVAAYGVLARFADGHAGRIGLDTAAELIPDLDVTTLDGAVAYHDHVTNDARLTLAVLQGAAERGALVVTRAEVAALRVAGGRVGGAELVDHATGRSASVFARSVVNATGPWVDHVRRLESPAAGTSVRLSRGVHVLLRGGDGWRAALTTPLEAGRVSFAVPWEGMLLVGTTDEPYDGDPAAVAARDHDVAQLLDEAAAALDPAPLARDRVLARFAGLRVLPQRSGRASRVRREVVIQSGPAGMVSVAGGKLTTWNAIGTAAARRALVPLGIDVPDGPPAPLPGAGPLPELERALRLRHGDLPQDVRRNLARHYGAMALDVLDEAAGDASMLERIHADGPDIWAQVPWAARREWAMTAEDVLLRRTTAGLRGEPSAALRDRVQRLLDAA